MADVLNYGEDGGDEPPHQHANRLQADCQTDLPEIQLGVSHKQIDGTPIQSFRADLRVLEQIKVEYEVMPGWLCDISSIRRYSKLPKTARQYVERIEELVGVPIHYIRIGPGRDVLV
ncbi:Adenylosuccinate synthetase [Forsythia ovata]|uniref:Adenylosuccinate synthetase n=1 Tax=Forsythia ovata TaxID=205694 RepID=A0ABD1TS52_9LAMI